MHSCTPTLSVLLLFAAVSTSAVPTVKVKLHDSAVLPCSEKCSGVISWSLYSESSVILAECDQNSCRSVKEGYQMIYNQYLQGDFSLIIPKADYSKRGYYTCDCDKKDICDVRLQIKTLTSTVHKKVGETLVLELNILDQVEVTYNSTVPANPSSRQFCRVERRAVEFGTDYKLRASLTSDLELSELKESDSGVYTVRDISNNEIIHIYTVTVHGDSGALDQKQKPSDPNSTPSPDCQGAAVPGWVVPVLGVMGVLLGVLLVVCVVLVVMWRKAWSLQRRSARNREPTDQPNNRQEQEAIL